MVNLSYGSIRQTTMVFGIITATLILQACGNKQEAAPQKEVIRPVKTLILGSADTHNSRRFPGTVRASDRVDLSFKVDGPLIELPVRQGDEIKKGDLIARIDPRDFQSKLNSAEARYTEAKSNYERGKTLVKDGFISKIQFDKLKSDFEQAEADLAIKKKALNDTYMKAPFGGKVAKRFVQNFQDVRAKEPIISLQDTAVIEVVVNAPERIVAGSRGDGSKGSAVAIFESVPGQKFPLTIKEFATEADPKTQTFEYVLIMPQPKDTNILPGMTATVLVTAATTKQESSGHTIPALAVFSDETGKSQVWVISQEDNTVHSRAVTTADLVGSDQIQIIEGLNNGDMIAVAGVSVLREGMQVRPVDTIKF